MSNPMFSEHMKSLSDLERLDAIPTFEVETEEVAVVHPGQVAATREYLEGCWVVVSGYGDQIVVSHHGPGHGDWHLQKHLENRPSEQKPIYSILFSLDTDKAGYDAERAASYHEALQEYEAEMHEKLGLEELTHATYDLGSEVIVDWRDVEAPHIFTQKAEEYRQYSRINSFY